MRLIDANKVNEHIVGWVDLRDCPTVDAIPVEWIKKQAFEHPQLNRNLFYQMIIEKWKEENETKTN